MSRLPTGAGRSVGVHLWTAPMTAPTHPPGLGCFAPFTEAQARLRAARQASDRAREQLMEAIRAERRAFDDVGIAYLEYDAIRRAGDRGAR